MSKILTSEFVDSIQELIDYCEEMDMRKSFVQADTPEVEIHRWRHVLIVKSYLGQEDISPEEAKQLMKTNLIDNVYIGNNDDGWEEAENYWNEEGSGEFTQRTIDDNFKLWI